MMKKEKGRKKEYSNVKIIKESKADLDFIAKSFDLKVGEVMEAMIAYFKHSGQNPKTYQDFKTELSELMEKQIHTHQSVIIQIIKSHKAEEVAKRANNLFKTFKKDLESQKTDLGYVGPVVSNTISIYLKQFDTLEKENSTFIFPIIQS